MLLFSTGKLMGHFITFRFHTNLFQHMMNLLCNSPFIFSTGGSKSKFQVFVGTSIEKQLKIRKNNSRFSYEE